MKKMVRNGDAFKQRFRTTNEVRTVFFFFRFWGHSPAYGQKKKKKSSPDPFHKNMVRKVYAAKISGPYQLFYGSGPIFFCGVNGGHETSLFLASHWALHLSKLKREYQAFLRG